MTSEGLRQWCGRLCGALGWMLEVVGALRKGSRAENERMG